MELSNDVSQLFMTPVLACNITVAILRGTLSMNSKFLKEFLELYQHHTLKLGEQPPSVFTLFLSLEQTLERPQWKPEVSKSRIEFCGLNPFFVYYCAIAIGVLG